jgi:hypothetical protein
VLARLSSGESTANGRHIPDSAAVIFQMCERAFEIEVEEDSLVWKEHQVKH